MSRAFEFWDPISQVFSQFCVYELESYGWKLKKPVRGRKIVDKILMASKMKLRECIFLLDVPYEKPPRWRNLLTRQEPEPVINVAVLEGLPTLNTKGLVEGYKIATFSAAVIFYNDEYEPGTVNASVICQGYDEQGYEELPKPPRVPAKTDREACAVNLSYEIRDKDFKLEDAQLFVWTSQGRWEPLTRSEAEWPLNTRVLAIQQDVSQRLSQFVGGRAEPVSERERESAHEGTGRRRRRLL
eukprot:GHVU01189054.1.p1 GENE.GHVU01189054.1~~GHVU01189054.1.p1  ORF type:complete len:242 (-),score=23.26 GHVU01189054.1:48-773(-)